MTRAASRTVTAALLAPLVLGATLVPGCSSGFGETAGKRILEVEIVEGSDRGSREAPLPLPFETPVPFGLRVIARRPDGTIDTSFNGSVRLSAKPGNLVSVSGENVSGRNVRLVGGTSPTVEVGLANAYGVTYLLADDLGYDWVDPTRDPPAACSDGRDNDGDGFVDFPADEGCAFANDDSETGSTFALGSSPPIFFRLPRIADVRGVNQGGGVTAFPKEQVTLDTGWSDDRRVFDFDVVVTRIASDGFYVSDVSDARGFNNVFAFNFSAPPRMRVCDRLKAFAGTATEFFGLTQIAYPTWTLEEYVPFPEDPRAAVDPRARPCLVPEPKFLAPEDISDTSLLQRLTAGLVRVGTENGMRVHVGAHFGPNDVRRLPLEAPEDQRTFRPEPDASNCDLNKDGQVDFDADPERACAAACRADVECTEYSNFAARSTFQIAVVSSSGAAAKIQAEATAATGFRPLERKGQELRSFAGTLHFFSGGAQYTIEARCDDDVVIPLDATPKPIDKACVFPRTEAELNPQ